MQSTLPPVDPKGPSEGKLYSMDWSGALNPGATILDSVWTTHPAGLTTALEGIVTGLTKTSARFTGGHRGVTYQVTNTISTSDGETLKRTGEIKVKDQ